VAVTATPSQNAAEDAGVQRTSRSALGALRVLRPILPLVTLCVIFTVINPHFITPTNLRGIVESNVVEIIAAVGATFVIVTGGIDLSVEGVILVSSVAVALLVKNSATAANLGLFGALIGCLLGTLFGLTNGALNVFGRIPSFAVTLGTWYIGVGLQTVLQAHFAQNGITVTDATITGMATEDKAGFSTLTLIALAIVIIAFVIERYTLLGRRAFAVGGDESVARMSGVPVRRTKILIFTLAGTLYGLAGFVYVVRFGGLGSGVSNGSILFGVITAIVVGGTSLSGGRGGVLYSFLGVLTLGALTNGLVLSGVNPFYQQIVEGALILVALTVATRRRLNRLEIVK
jgi:ribose transport system permease protein